MPCRRCILELILSCALTERSREELNGGISFSKKSLTAVECCMTNKPHELWIRKAEEEFNTAIRELKVHDRASYDVVCVLCQQCAEKYLKAFLVFSGMKYEWTHDLLELLDECRTIDPTFEFIRDECARLNGMMRLRYPVDFASIEEATIALNDL